MLNLFFKYQELPDDLQERTINQVQVALMGTYAAGLSGLVEATFIKFAVGGSNVTPELIGVGALCVAGVGTIGFGLGQLRETSRTFANRLLNPPQKLAS